MADECRAYAATLIAWSNVGMADEINIAYWLNTHHADYVALAVIGPKGDSRGNFRIQLQQTHIGVVPSIGWNDASVGFGRCIDNLRNYQAFVFAARADRVHGARLIAGRASRMEVIRSSGNRYRSGHRRIPHSGAQCPRFEGALKEFACHSGCGTDPAI